MAAWCRERGLPHGSSMALGVLWQVARTWYEGRLDAAPLTRTMDDKQALLTQAGLTGAFWTLR